MSEEKKSTVLPFHFVPVGSAERRGDVPWSEIDLPRNEGILHHRFVDGRRSGRLLCRLTTETPTVLGGERGEAADGRPAEVQPFLLDGSPAIPASSLRGMISAIAEAASNSALRVLENRAYSFRKPAEHALRKFGEVIVEESDGGKKYWVRQLPVVRVAGVDTRGDPLETARDGGRRSYGLRHDHPRKGAKLTPWEDIPPAEHPQYKHGFVRVLAGRGRDLPDSRKFEIFVPYDPENDEETDKIPIADAAVERFHDLADERTNAVRKRKVPPLPYEPLGTRRNEKSEHAEDRLFRLKHGDFVFYWQKGGEAVEIALSAIWRGRVEGSDRKPLRAWSFFQALDPDLVPFHAGRDRLTMGEQLFGFVSEGELAEGEEPAPALASRVRFGAGRLIGDHADPFLEPVTLRILDSPKPPSPSLYFSDFDDGNYIAKDKLNPEHHRPQGRKLYVHQLWEPGSDPETWPWRTEDETDRPEMKSRVEPLRAGLPFVFHLDYDNLSDDELGLLLYALRPTPAFRHKLGMGKPLGLGTVRVEVLGLFEVDRQRRYRAEGLFQPRHAFVGVEPGVDLSLLGHRYAPEREAAGRTAGGGEHAEELRRTWRESMDPEIRNALERLGEERFDPRDVSVPLVLDAEDREKETFKWFVAYDKRKEDATLTPIGSRGTSWPRLERLKEWDPEEEKRGGGKPGGGRGKGGHRSRGRPRKGRR